MMPSPFNHVDAIYNDQRIEYFDSLGESDKKAFSSYMINRIISMNADYLPIVNEFQTYYNIVNGRDTYLFYSQLLPKKKQFNKYVKGTKESKHDPWLINLIATHYGVSQLTATDYISLCIKSENGKTGLRDICRIYGVDLTLLKKVKL
jgi:hypothetical protein